MPSQKPIECSKNQSIYVSRMLTALKMKTTSAPASPPPKLEGVLVEMDGGGGGGHPSSGSGVRWGRLVLTHGCLLPPGSAAPSEGPLSALQRPPVGRPRVITEAGTVRARVRAAWRCPLLAASTRQLVGRGWSFVSPKQQGLAQLVVLQVGDGDDMSVDEIREHLGTLLRDCVAEPHDGQQVLLESTPFGAGNFFLNSWTSGIVSSALNFNFVCLRIFCHVIARELALAFSCCATTAL